MNLFMVVIRGRMGERIVRELRMDPYTLLYSPWITSKDLPSSTGAPAPCSVAAWMEGEPGVEQIQVRVSTVQLNDHSAGC